MRPRSNLVHLDKDQNFRLPALMLRAEQPAKEGNAIRLVFLLVVLETCEDDELARLNCDTPAFAGSKGLTMDSVVLSPGKG